VNSLGGFLKQYEVAVNPNLLKSMGISITNIYDALQNSNENTGGAYIEKNPNSYFIRTNGIAQSLTDIEKIVVEVRNGKPILIEDVATVQFGKAPRYGAATRDGKEVINGMVMMLKGENSAAVTERIKERVVQIQKSLPEGVLIEPYLVRDKLISTAIGTVKTNLLEGGLIVIFILVLMLGNWRAGLIVASVIPLSMLFAVSMMNLLGISANLMSLGAIDFGLIVDGAVIIVESIVHRLQVNFAGQKLTASQMNNEVKTASQKIRSSAAFGEIIIRMGGEFIPTLDEGDLALHQILPPGSSLTQSVEISKIIQKKLLAEFPEIEEVVTKIGSAEIPTDPMPVETGDIMVIMKPKSEWTSASTRTEMFEKMEKTLQSIPGLAYEFSQPIQMRFNELMTGSRADIAIKLFGNDLAVLFEKAKETEKVIRNIEGIGTIKVEQTVGMPQIIVDFDYNKMAQYGLQVKEINQVIRTAFAGEMAGTIYEGDRRFDLVVRLDERYRNDIKNVEDLYITLDNGTQVPLQAVAKVELINAPMQISRENTNRRIVIGVNVGNTDVETLVSKIQTELDAKIDLPAGYYFTYGGQFENLKAANARLMIAVPMALALIFIMLYFTFGSIAHERSITSRFANGIRSFFRLFTNGAFQFWRCGSAATFGNSGDWWIDDRYFFDPGCFTHFI